MKRLQRIPWYIWIVFVLLGAVVCKFTLGTTFLFSTDGWNTTERQINSSRVVARGVGNEPGWLITIRGEESLHTVFGVDLVLDYGEKHMGGVLAQKDREGSFEGELYVITDDTMTDEKQLVRVLFEKRTCVDDAGNTREYEVTVKVGESGVYRGCGEVM